jgi:branched-chain amino acid transport system permease protein
LPFVWYTLDSVRQLQLVIMGVVLVWLMHNRPEGLLGHRKETASSINLSVRRNRGVATDGGDDDE